MEIFVYALWATEHRHFIMGSDDGALMMFNRLNGVHLGVHVAMCHFYTCGTLVPLMAAILLDWQNSASIIVTSFTFIFPGCLLRHRLSLCRLRSNQ